MFTARSPMRSRSVTIFNAVVISLRSEAAGCRRARIFRHSSSMSTSSRLISTSPSFTCSPSSESRSVSDRMLLAICSSTFAPMARSFSRTRRRSDSNALSVCEVTLPELAGDIVLRPSLARVGEDLGGGPDLDQLTEIEERSVIRDARRLLHGVRHDDDGVLLLELVDELLDLRSGDGVERRGRLVHQKDLGLYRQSTGDAEALLLATRQRRAGVLQPVFHFVPQRRLAQAALDDLRVVPAHAVERQPRGHVLVDAHRRERVGALEDHSHPAAEAHRVDAPGVEVLAVDEDLAFDAGAGDQIVHPVQ